MSNHERSPKSKTVAFFKPTPPLLRQERVTHDLDKRLNDNSPRVLSHDLFCTFASLQPGKRIDNTVQRKLKQGKL